MKKQSVIILIIASAFGLRVPASAQSCTGATCTAASASQSDFLAALPSSGNTNSTVVVNIPAGTAAWSSGISYTIPAAVTNLTIQGATTVNCTGTAGTSSYACSASDRTVIQDNWNNGTGQGLLQFITGGNSSSFRITGITLAGGTTTQSKYGQIDIKGNTWNLRIDHNHFNNEAFANPYQVSTAAGRIEGQNKGVIDHNLFDLATCNGAIGGVCNAIEAGFEAFNTLGDDIGFGDGTWAKKTPWGTDAFIFMENNVFNGGAPNDCASAGTFVMRYNTINDAYVGIQTHATKSQAGPERGCRAYEAYHNYLTGPADGGSTARASGAMGSKIGTSLVWGNTMAEGYYRLFQACTDRNCGSTTETSAPSGWGFCGTSSINASTGSANGVGSPWDGNSSSSTGYPCLDGLGRGQTQQPLNGQAQPNRANSVTGGISWPHQLLEPIYMWANSIPSWATYAMVQDITTKNNQDYYYDCGSKNSSCTGGFTGAAGTGYGTLASRPSTCTAGPGGTYGTSPTGSYGVGYFATDANSGNGELYVCTSTNTWTGIYQPYQYPHPLVSGSSGTTASTPPAPTNLVSTAY